MRTVYEREVANAAKIEGQIARGKDGYVRSLVGPVCRVIWPGKTDHHIAGICGCDPRNARRYMSGEIPIPSILVAAIVVEITKRD
jgi:hypothetical protein